MRYDFVQILKELLTDVDGLGHFMVNLGHLQMNSQGNYKLGKIGDLWKADERPPEQDEYNPGWEFSSNSIPLSEPPTPQELVEAPILVIDSFPEFGGEGEYVKTPIRLKQSNGEASSITRYFSVENTPYEFQLEGFSSLKIANISDLPSSKGFIEKVKKVFK